MQSYGVRKKNKQNNYFKCYFSDYHHKLVDLLVPCFNLHSFLIVHEVMSPLAWFSSLIGLKISDYILSQSEVETNHFYLFPLVFPRTAPVARVCCDWLE